MFGKTNNSVKRNPWGDDHPEKANDKPKTIGINQQIQGLFNPDSLLDQMLNRQNGHESPFPRRHEKPHVKPPETVVFKHEVRSEEVKVQRETNELLKKLQQQVTILEKKESNLVDQVSKITVEQMPAKTGIYYLRYLEWLLTIVKQLMMKVDEGQAWLNAFSSRSKKKTGYWGKYKKHGTSFGLSNERTLATQTG